MVRKVIVLVALGAISRASAAAEHCSREMAGEAESVAAAAQSWQDLFEAYSSYRVCDDAAIAEGFSDSVTRLLSSNGSGLRQLAGLVAKDAAFLHFVAKHIEMDQSRRPSTRLASCATFREARERFVRVPN